MFSRQNVALEITSQAVYVSVGDEQGRILVFPSIEEALKSIPRFSNIKISLARDTFFLRKIKLPLEAIDYIKENPNHLARELFPHNSLKIYNYILPESGEVLFFGIPEDLLEIILKDKRVKFVTLSPFLYPLKFGDISFARVFRKISDKFYEYSIFKDNKLLDSFLVSPEESEDMKKNADIFLEDTFEVISLLQKANSENINFYILSKEKYNKLKFLLLLLNLFLAFLSIYEFSVYINVKKKFEESEKRLDILKNTMNKYYKYIEENRKLKDEINKLNGLKSKSLYYLWQLSKLLPQDVKLRNFTYEHKKAIIIEGETLSMSNLLKILTDSGLFKEIKVEYIQKIENKENFRIKLLL